MNVYDEANNLARALKESNEYQNFQKAEKALSEDAEHKKIAQDYIKKQMNLQMKQMMNQELTEDEINAYNTLTQSVMGIPVIADYLQSQMYFAMIYNEIMQIVTSAVKLDSDFLKEALEEEQPDNEE